MLAFAICYFDARPRLESRQKFHEHAQIRRSFQEEKKEKRKKRASGWIAEQLIAKISLF